MAKYKLQKKIDANNNLEEIEIDVSSQIKAHNENVEAHPDIRNVLNGKLDKIGGTLTGEVTIGQGDGKGLQFGTNGVINANNTTNTIFGLLGNGALTIGHSAFNFKARGKGTNPTYNDKEIALKENIPVIPDLSKVVTAEDATGTELEPTILDNYYTKTQTINKFATNESVDQKISAIPKPDISSKVNKSGDTMTGQLIVQASSYGIVNKGTAASNAIVTRGIMGSGGDGDLGELYLNYGTSSATRFGNSGQSSLNGDGSITIPDINVG